MNVFEGEGGGGVAGDDETVGTLLVEELCALYCVAGDGGLGFCSVGETGGVAEVDVVGRGDAGQQGAEDGEASEAGVEDAYGGVGHLEVVGCWLLVAISYWPWVGWV